MLFLRFIAFIKIHVLLSTIARRAQVFHFLNKFNWNFSETIKSTKLKDSFKDSKMWTKYFERLELIENGLRETFIQIIIVVIIINKNNLLLLFYLLLLILLLHYYY